MLDEGAVSGPLAWGLVGGTGLAFLSGLFGLLWTRVATVLAVGGIPGKARVCQVAMSLGVASALVSGGALARQSPMVERSSPPMRTAEGPSHAIRAADGASHPVREAEVGEGRQVHLDLARMFQPEEVRPDSKQYTYCVCVPVDGLELVGHSGVWELYMKGHCHLPETRDRDPKPAEYWIYKHIVTLEQGQTVPQFPGVQLSGRKAGQYKMGVCWGPGTVDLNRGEHALRTLQERGGRSEVIVTVSAGGP